MKSGRLHPNPGWSRTPDASFATSAPLRRCEGLESIGLQPDYRPPLYSAHQPVHGHGRQNANYIAGTPYLGADVKMYAGPGGNRGVFTAWDPVAQRKVLEIKEDLPLWSGPWRPPAAWSSTARWTAGSKRSTRAPASCCGSSRPAAGSSVSRSAIADPTAGNISRCLPASAAGPARSSPPSSTRAIPTAALGMVNAVKDLPTRSTAGGMLYVFALPR